MFQIMDRARQLEAEGREIIHLEIGDPDFPSPSAAIAACKEALDTGYTHYVSSYGDVELRRTGAMLTERSRGFRPDIEQIVVTAGANIQIYYVVACTVDPGEEVIILDPSFVSYEAIIRVVGGVAVKVPLRETNGFEPDIVEVEAAITSKTRLIIVNSPHNPTGAVYSEATMEGLYRLAVKHDLFLLSDEVYGRMVFPDSDTQFFSPSVFDRCRERVVICHSLSKSYSMTGWRIGALTAPEFLARKIALLLETTSSCVAPFIQRGAAAALNDGNIYSANMIEEYCVRRDLMVAAINEIPGVYCHRPQGTFYTFVNVVGTGLRSEEFSELLLDQLGVATCPGNYFGQTGEGYVRFCFARSTREIERAAERLKSIKLK
jgi:aspartate/methionine/tyrosine aminotransferase